MKRGTPTHPKTLALATALGLERWGAVGVLESLWHFTANYAKRGDIGRFSDDVIAEGIGWQSASSKLVGCLHAASWITACSCHRFRIHDWPDHADQTVRRSEVVQKEGFLECYDDASSVLASSQQHASQPTPLPTPLPTPKPEPKPSAIVATRRKAPQGNWVTEACKVWNEETGGIIAPGRMGRAVKALVAQVKASRSLGSDLEAWELMAPALRHYLQTTEGRFATPEGFAKAPRQEPHSKEARQVQETKQAVRAWLSSEEAVDGKV